MRENARRWWRRRSPSLATQSGPLFFAGTQDFYLRAYDSGTRQLTFARIVI